MTYPNLIEARQLANAAFDAAIITGRLSANKLDDNYVGLYMYMGEGQSGDKFKNIITREYLK